MARYPPFHKSLAAQEESLRERHIGLKNIGKARLTYANSASKIQFVCLASECQHPFASMPANVLHKNRPSGCPFCCSPPKRLCGKEDCAACFRKSIASIADDLVVRDIAYCGAEDPMTIFRNQHKKALFKCLRAGCGHDFEITPHDVTAGKGCGFCSSTRLCGIEKNCGICLSKTVAGRADDLVIRKIEYRGEVDARLVFAGSNTMCLWRCLDPACGSSWEAAANSVFAKRPTGCPGCARHKTERMIAEYCQQIWGSGGALRADWCRNTGNRCLPFDIYIESLGILIEVDGEQHFREIKHFNRHWSFGEIQDIDMFKQQCALQNGCHVIRMHQEDVLYGRINWQKELHNAVCECVASDTTKLCFIAADISCYENHCKTQDG